MTGHTLQQAARAIQRGGVVAYPTESVYGLGCDPMNYQAVMRLLKIKKRPASKGLILIAASVSQLQALLLNPPANNVLKTWPGPVTWLLPGSDKVPAWIRGQHNTIAVRVTAHPVASALCRACGHAIVSTSANVSHQHPARTRREVFRLFGQQLDVVLAGRTDIKKRPSRIVEGSTGKVIRA